MKYYVIDEDKYFDNYEDAIEYCINSEYHYDDDYFEEWVNETYGHIDIYGNEYYAYDILKNMDESELDNLLSSYCENENESDRENAMYEFRNASPGDTVLVQAYEIKVIDETGDTDGDEELVDSLESVRQYLEEQSYLNEQAKKQEEEDENEVMNLFQVIS